jgi:hypothetical protein
MNGKTILILAAAACLLALAACDTSGGGDPAVKVTYSTNKTDSGAVPVGPTETSRETA